MSIQDPTPNAGQTSYSTQAPGYVPVSDPSAQQGGAVPPVDPYGPGYGGPVYPGAPLPGAPNPGLAALLGFIPGVGAMYNGQFPKGIAHIAIFAVFSSLSKNANGIFGLFVAGWVFYMVFEAYQTARARRDGLPLPDPFGLNNIGERFGFRGSPDFSSFWGSGPAGGVPPAPPVAGPGGYGATPGTPGAAASYQVDPAGNVFSAAAAAGYAPPASTPPTGYPPYAPPAQAPYGAAEYPGAPYAGAPYPPMPPMPSVPRNGLPAGAIWLIGLGFFALLGSMRTFAFLEGEATGGLFLLGLSGFLFWRRYSANRSLYPAGSTAARWNMLRESRGAATVGVVGLLTLLQGLHVVNWENSWPFLLIFLGLFILVERLAMNGMQSIPPYAPAAYPGAPATAPEPVVDTASPTSILPRYTRPSNDLHEGEGR